jgi:RNA polymerase sigma-70 factor, ECF subfamily
MITGIQFIPAKMRQMVDSFYVTGRVSNATFMPVNKLKIDMAGSNKYEQELILKIRNDDRDAFETLFRRYYIELCHFVQRYVNEPAICEDLIQELFLRLWLHRNKWELKGSVKAYLYKSAQNKAFDYFRHKKIESEIEWESYKLEYLQQESQQEQVIDEELLAAVHKAVNKLPERMKQIFTLSRDDGLSYPEIADVLELSVKTVETQMGRALKSLRQQLSDYFRNKS